MMAINIQWHQVKQTNETIMVFKKPTKTGSVLHDAIAYENGDNEITVSSIDIDSQQGWLWYGKIQTQQQTQRIENWEGYKMLRKKVSQVTVVVILWSSKNEIKLDGRYPAQTFVDQGAANMLDEQSGTLAGNNSIGGGTGGIWTKETNNRWVLVSTTQVAQAKPYTIQPDLYHYQPKVNNMGRNAGLGDDFTGGRSCRQGLSWQK